MNDIIITGIKPTGDNLIVRWIEVGAGRAGGGIRKVTAVTETPSKEQSK